MQRARVATNEESAARHEGAQLGQVEIAVVEHVVGVRRAQHFACAAGDTVRGGAVGPGSASKATAPTASRDGWATCRSPSRSGSSRGTGTVAIATSSIR